MLNRYSQAEKEALAIVWGCERLHFYLYGVHFTIQSDHKPLTVLYSPSGKPSARIMRWALRLLPYSFTIKHIPGISNPADYFSRKPTDLPSDSDDTLSLETEGHVNSVIMTTVPNAISLQEVLGESLKDPEIIKLVQRINDGKWNLSPELKPFFTVKDELSTKGGLVLRESRLVIPKSLQNRSVELAHASHLGLAKTKQYLRSKVWWPGMEIHAENLIKNCGICQAVNPDGKERLEPLKIKAAPIKPFSTVHIDLFGPLKTGISILGIIDEFSRWPECYVLDNTQTKHIISSLDKTFGRFGSPDIIVSDNGPQFISWEFKNYLSSKGIRSHLVTPYYPQANSSIERFFRSLKKYVKVCKLSKKELSEQLHEFLYMYRNTVIRATGHTPAEMILRFCPKGNLPQIKVASDKFSQKMYSGAQKSDLDYKQKAKLNADKYQKRVTSNIMQGDVVLVKSKFTAKADPVFDPAPFIVTKRIGNCVYLERNGKPLRRPLDHCKCVPPYNWSEGNKSKEFNESWLEMNNTDDSIIQHDEGNIPTSPSTHSFRGGIDYQSFRDNVFRDMRIVDQNQLHNNFFNQPPITGSGRISRPVIGTRLYIDE